MRIHIKHGHLIDPKNKINVKKDLVLEKGKVAEILSSGSKVSNAQVIDATSLTVSPGFIDLHVHLREPGQEYKETIETGTKAAAAGGFTSVCCMANTIPVNDQAAVTQYILKKAAESGVIGVYPIGALTKGLEGKVLAQIGELKKSGCVGLSDDGKYVQDAQVMRLAMSYAKNFNLPVISHALDGCLGCGGVMHEGSVSTRLGLRGIPSVAEDIAIAREIYLAELTGARLHIAHLSTAEGLALVRKAKKQGLPVTCEVTPHHLFLTDARVEDYDTDAKMAPPLRTQKDCDALVKGLADGTVDAIATDHAPHALVDKEVEFDQAAFGVVGLETAFSLVLKLVHDKKISQERLIELLTSSPAAVVGLEKGSLEKGADADVTLFDPHEKFEINPSQFYSKSRNTPFGGWKLKGRVTHTIFTGRVVYERGKIV